jgi:tetratricopeptide (TPR) repeat protein
VLGDGVNVAARLEQLAEFERAIELAPDIADVLYSVATELAFLGRTELAVEVAERAARLNPDGDYRRQLARTYLFARRFADAAAQIEVMDEVHGIDNLFAAFAYTQLGRTPDLNRWRARLEEHLPAYVFEEWASQGGDFAPGEVEPQVRKPCAPSEAWPAARQGRRR